MAKKKTTTRKPVAKKKHKFEDNYKGYDGLEITKATPSPDTLKESYEEGQTHGIHIGLILGVFGTIVGEMVIAWVAMHG